MNDQTMKELMITDILQVHLMDSMQTIYSQLSEQPDRFVVVLDDEKVPLYVITADEMKRKMPRSLDWPSVRDFAARLPEALLVDEKVALGRAMVFFHMMETSPRPPGLVVVRDKEVVGVLPYDVLADYFNKVTVPELEVKGQTVRKSQPVDVPNAVFRCRRYPRCSYKKTVSQVDESLLCKIPAHGRMVLVQ